MSNSRLIKLGFFTFVGSPPNSEFICYSNGTQNCTPPQHSQKSWQIKIRNSPIFLKLPLSSVNKNPSMKFHEKSWSAHLLAPYAPRAWATEAFGPEKWSPAESWKWGGSSSRPRLKHWNSQPGSHTLHTSHNHWKGKSMEKWWIWIYDNYDLILSYSIQSLCEFQRKSPFPWKQRLQINGSWPWSYKKRAMVT